MRRKESPAQAKRGSLFCALTYTVIQGFDGSVLGERLFKPEPLGRATKFPGWTNGVVEIRTPCPRRRSIWPVREEVLIPSCGNPEPVIPGRVRGTRRRNPDGVCHKSGCGFAPCGAQWTDESSVLQLDIKRAVSTAFGAFRTLSIAPAAGQVTARWLAAPWNAEPVSTMMIKRGAAGRSPFLTRT